MKKNVIYILLALLVGLLIGFLIFNNKSTNKQPAHNHPAEEQAKNQMWTCSMHPQIMQPEPGECPICGMELIPAEEGAGGLSPNEIKMTENALALANVQTMVVGMGQEGEQDNTITLSGKIMSNEEANTVQASYFEGRIEKLYVNFTGDQVRKGQLLASIYAPSLVNAQQELITLASMKESQPGLYKAVRNKLKLWKLSESQINKIESSGRVKEIFPIYATVSGTVSQKLAEEGDYVAKGQPLLKLNNLGSVWAMFDAYENEIANLKVGDKITVTTNAYPDKTYDATISFIDPVLNVSSRTIKVRATLSNRGGLLKPGMFAVGEVSKESHNQVNNIQVPSSAIMWTGDKSLVYVKTRPDQPIFEMREITIGQRYGDMYAITSGISTGDEVVVNGTFTIDAAAQIQGKKSMMMHAQEDKHAHAAVHDRVEVAPAFTAQIKDIFNAYITLKDALVQDNAKESQEAAKVFQKNVNQVKTNNLEQQKTKDMWSQMSKNLKNNSSGIAATVDIEKQRQHFIELSNAMVHTLHVFGINQTVYQMYCPMANSDKGAYWLSKEQEVLNPYFGSAMLNCGEVREEIK